MMENSLTYTNARGEFVSFDTKAPYRLLSVDDLGGLEAVQQTVQSPYQDGVTPVGEAYFDMRTLDVKVAILSPNMTDAIRNLNAILNPRIGLGSLLYWVDGLARSLDKVKIRTMPSLPDDPGSAGFSIQIVHIFFDAYDPLYTDGTDTVITVESGSDLLEFPLDIVAGMEFDTISVGDVVATNVGDVAAPFSLGIDGPTDAPLVVTNDTTGEKITINAALLGGERLTITTGIGDTNVILSDLATGEAESAFQYIDIANTTFFLLVPGNNRLTVTVAGTDAESVTIRFRNRYVGI